jgi:hypothetical protein
VPTAITATTPRAIDVEVARSAGQALASWTGVALDAFRREPTASSERLCMRTADAQVFGAATPGPRFRIRLTLEVPRAATMSAVRLLKLLDRAISAFHDYVVQTSTG